MSPVFLSASGVRQAWKPLGLGKGPVGFAPPPCGRMAPENAIAPGEAMTRRVCWIFSGKRAAMEKSRIRPDFFAGFRRKLSSRIGDFWTIILINLRKRRFREVRVAIDTPGCVAFDKLL